ncbi:unnamed protein product [Soboliphyme baturini]|uniref:Uncharacterized protein n=1 Tax=Soboliphyme baturini TaxID=241478 RepID=A0A183IA15_9BILA|nr:unnamed protein product [Soboliphyme baturini]
MMAEVAYVALEQKGYDDVVDDADNGNDDEEEEEEVGRYDDDLMIRSSGLRGITEVYRCNRELELVNTKECLYGHVQETWLSRQLT